MASNIVLSNTDFKVVGTRPVRHDGTDKSPAAPNMGPTSMRPDCCSPKCFAALMPTPASSP